MVALIVIPTRKHAGNAHDDVLVISRNQVVLRIQHQRAVGPHPIQADREQLHDLAGVILVGMGAGDDTAHIVGSHVEEEPHRRREGDRFE